MFLMAGAAGVVPGQTGEKLLMVHADDSGMCHSANVATIEALKHGMVVSTSIMMPCGWVPEMAEYARTNPQADLGLHLTLTSEWRRYRWRPVAPAAQVPGLLDADGYLHRDVRAVAMKATAKEVETEVRAQIALARQYGIQFTHLDSHMGTLFARPDYFEVYTRVAKETGVPCMLPRPTPAAAKEMSAYPITPAMLEAANQTGLPYLDRLVTGVPGRTVAERAESYRKFLAELKPGITKLIVHLAMDDDEIKAITGNWEQRYADFRFFTDPETKKRMAELGIRTITYRELGQRSK
jgi:predicted glycoside hydrolase/deacetylase ChbG (UPF0249 family)